MNRLYVMTSSLRNDIFEIPGNVFSTQLEMITERGFPLLAKFDIIINRMKDMGIISKIHNDFIYNMTRKQHLDSIQKHSGQTVLTVDHLQGAFAIMILGHLISFLVFILEIISKSHWFNQVLLAATNRVYQLRTNILVLLKLQEQPKSQKRI